MNRSVLTTLIVWSLIVAVLPASHAFSTIPFENPTNTPLNLADTLIDNSYDVANFSYKASDGMERSNISATSFNVTEPFIDQLEQQPN